MACNWMFYLDPVCFVLLERVPGISLSVPSQGLMKASACLSNWSGEALDPVRLPRKMSEARGIETEETLRLSFCLVPALYRDE